MKIRLYKIVSAILITTIILLGGCSKKSTVVNQTKKEIIPTQGGTINIACLSPDTLNPLASRITNVREVLMTVYEGLFVSQSSLVAKPVLASGFSVSTSNKIYSINLKKNVKFHDGTSFDATDVISTFDYITNYDTPYTNIFNNVLSYSKTDDYTVMIELISPQADFANNLDFPILPSGLAEQSFTTENDSFVPIGTGRFMFDSRVHNKEMLLKRNDDWHIEKTTYADEIHVSFMNNEDELFYAFDAGEIDVFTTNGSNWGEFNFTSNHISFETGSPRYSYMGINTTKAPLDNVTLRRDIYSVINREDMAETVMFSHAYPAELPIISLAHYFDNKDYIAKQHDITYELPEKMKYNITLTLLCNSGSNTKQRAASSIKKQLEPYGIKIDILVVEFEDYKNLIAGGEYDMYIGEIVMENNMNMDFMFNSLQKTQENICTFVNEEFDVVLANYNMISPDKENSEIMFFNFVKYFKENVPQIPLFHINSAIYINNRLKGEITPNMSSFYSDIGDFYIKYQEKENVTTKPLP